MMRVQMMNQRFFWALLAGRASEEALEILGWPFASILLTKEVEALDADILWHRGIVVCYTRGHCSAPPLEDTGSHIFHHTHLSLRILHEWREGVMVAEEDA